jgi:protein gp37
VFCASLADVFENWEGVIFAPGKQPVILNKRWHASARMADRATLDDVRARLFALIAATPNLDWLLLTKRPENIGPMWPMPMNDREPGDELVLRRENVWLLTSIAEQTDVDRNLPLLLNHRDMAPVLGLSCEPLIGPLQLGLDRIWCRYHQCFEASACMDESEPCFRWQSIVGDMLDWVIVGGESGHHARPMHPDWARSIRDQCQAAGVPYFFKQWGEWIEGDVVPGGDLGGDFRRGKANILAGDGSENDGHFRRARRDVIVRRVGKKAAGRLLDGREWNEYPRVEVAAN